MAATTKRPGGSGRVDLAIAARLGARLLGDDVPPPLRPVAAAYFVRVVGGSAIVAYQGVWAATALHVGGARLGAFFAAVAAAGVVGGYAGGHISDHVGRTRVIVAGYIGAAAALALVPLLSAGAFVSLALVVAGAFAYAFGNAAHYALATDVVPLAEQERAFATMRVVQNLGVVLGPLVASLLVRVSWTALFIGSAATIGAAVTLGARLPASTSATRLWTPERPRPSSLLRDRAFLVFWGVNFLAACTYAAYETLLPVSATTRHGLSPALWGLVLVINPALVIALQLRLTRWSQRFNERLRLAIACLLMGTPFLLLSLVDSIAAFALVLGVFVLGEMLWVPTSSAALVKLAPAERRGAYLGVFNAGVPLALAVVPFVGFPLADAAGDTAMWAFVAVIGAVAAVSFALLATLLKSPGRDEPRIGVAPAID